MTVSLVDLSQRRVAVEELYIYSSSTLHGYFHFFSHCNESHEVKPVQFSQQITEVYHTRRIAAVTCPLDVSPNVSRANKAQSENVFGVVFYHIHA